VISAGEARWLGNWPPGVGNASELWVNFSLLAGSGSVVSFGVAVLAGRDPASGQNTSMPITVDVDTSRTSANVTIGGILESPYSEC